MSDDPATSLGRMVLGMFDEIERASEGLPEWASVDDYSIEFGRKGDDRKWRITLKDITDEDSEEDN